MQAFMIFVLLMIFSMALYIYYTIRIIGELRKRDVHINYLFLRSLVIQYVQEYKQITTRECGRPGEYYRPWILSISATSICALIAIMLKALG